MQKNVHKLHKQVFVKVRVSDSLASGQTEASMPKSFKSLKKVGFGNNREPHNSKSFRSSLIDRKKV